MRQPILIFFMASVFAANAHAGFFDSFANQTVQTNSAPSYQDNGISSQATSEILTKSRPVYDVKNDDNGLEYKLDSASAMATLGAVTAGATGAALVGRAIPLLGSIFPWDRAAGAALMAKAGLEFAQSAVDAAVAQANAEGRDKLLFNDSGNDGASGYSIAAPATATTSTAKLPVELDDYLNQKGVDAEAFKAKLLSGRVGDAASVLAAMGDTRAISDFDMEKGQASASGIYAQVKKEAFNQNGLRMKEAPSSASSSSSESDETQIEGDGGEVITTVGTSAPGSFAEAQALEAAAQNLQNHGSQTATAASRSLTSLSSSQKSGDGADGEDEEGFLSNLLKSVTGQSPNSERAIQAEAVLKQAGVQVTRAKSNIFTTAGSNFRSFHKWRKATAKNRVASRS